MLAEGGGEHFSQLKSFYYGSFADAANLNVYLKEKRTVFTTGKTTKND
jgi:hypothetical protein